MTVRELPQEVLRRAAVVYVRQSTGLQVQENLESQRRQYDLVETSAALWVSRRERVRRGSWPVCQWHDGPAGVS